MTAYRLRSKNIRIRMRCIASRWSGPVHAHASAVTLRRPPAAFFAVRVAATDWANDIGFYMAAPATFSGGQGEWPAGRAADCALGSVRVGEGDLFVTRQRASDRLSVLL